MSQAQVLEGRLKRDISTLGFAAMTVNGVIGAGIFGLPGGSVGHGEPARCGPADARWRWRILRRD